MVLDILVQERRYQEAAERFPQRVVVTDKLRRYGPPSRRCCPERSTTATKGWTAARKPPPTDTAA
jgi:hypothetical protein